MLLKMIGIFIITYAGGYALRVIFTMLRDYWPQMVEAMLIGVDPYCDRCGKLAEARGFLCDACSTDIANGADYEAS